MPPNTTKSPPETMCLKCGLCCDGVIFADIKLQPKEDVQRLLSLGLHLRASGHRDCHKREDGAAQPQTSPCRNGTKLLQPCAAFDGCRCRIYPERPLSCRQFDCKLLQRLKGRDITPAQTLRVIRLGRRRVDKVLRLLRKLGDTDEQLALNTRFRQTTKRMEEATPDKHVGRIYGQLTLAMHELHNVLSEFFYPG